MALLGRTLGFHSFVFIIHIVEKVVGISYEEFVEQYILEPLSMDYSTYEYNAFVQENIVKKEKEILTNLEHRQFLYLKLKMEVLFDFQCN